MPRVEIYTKFFCPFCMRAKALLDGKGIAYDEHDVTMGGSGRTEMMQRSNGRTTVPQVFVGTQHIGGSDDLAAAEKSGELDRLLGLAT